MNHWRSICKKIWGSITVDGFLQSLQFHTQRKDGANTTCKEPVTTIIILHKNTKAMVWSLDDDTDFFNIVAGILQGDKLVPCLLKIYLDYALWTSIDLIKENGFTIKMTRSKWYALENMSDADYIDDLVFLTNIPA